MQRILKILIWLIITSIITGCAREPPLPTKHLPENFIPSIVKEAFINHLEKEVLPFWTSSQLCDQQFDGFLPWINTDLKRTDKTEKHLFVHLRLLLIHALAIARSCPELDQIRIRIQYDKQMRFFKEKFWDPVNEKWYANLTRDGRPIDINKQLIAQIYVIYMMSEIYRLIKDQSALEIAEKTLRSVDGEAHDEIFGGYFEYEIQLDHEKIKSVNTNMHMALALSKLIHFSDEQIYRQRLNELYTILTSNPLISKSGNVCMLCTRDWRMFLDGDESEHQILYGHNAELVWIMIEIAEALDRDPKEIQFWLETVANGVIKNGIGSLGEVYVWGSLTGDPKNTNEIRWWPQCEVMIMLIRMFELTGDRIYWSLFEKVTRFTFDKFVVDHSGAWLGGVDLESGKRFDRGGWAMKSGFHVARMLVECASVLESVDKLYGE